MQINEASMIIALLWYSALIILIHILRKRIVTSGNGFNAFLVLALICLLRAIFPVELPPLKYVSVKSVYSPILFFVRDRFTIGGVSLSVGDFLLGIWGIVAVVLLFRYAYKYVRSIKGIKDTFMDDEELSEILKGIQGDRNAHRIKIVRNSYIDTPISAGVMKQYIVIPKYANGQNVYYMVRHELSHIQNGDLILKMFLNILCCILWFNPFVYLLRRDIGQAIEVRCDKKVTADMDDEKKAEYLEMILSVFHQPAKKSRLDNNYLYLFGDMEAVSIKERFTAVETMQRTTPWRRLENVVIVTILALLVMVSYMYSSKQYQAAAERVEELASLPDIVPLSWDSKINLLKIRMNDYDVDGERIDPVTGLAGLMSNDIPLEERHQIIDIPDDIRQRLFDEVKEGYLQEYGLLEEYTQNRSELYRECLELIPKGERLKASWTIEQYERQYSQAINDCICETNPLWEWGMPFDGGIIEQIKRDDIEKRIISDGTTLSLNGE